MSEVVLAVLQRHETAPGVLRAAGCLAALAGGAHVTGLAAQVPHSPALPALKAAFDTWAGEPREGVATVGWQAAPDSPQAAVEERGGRVDLIVVARPGDDDDRTTREVFKAALLRTDRPVLVVPPDALSKGASSTLELGRRPAIAWRNDPHTAKAVMPALRYLRQAELVFVLAGAKEGKPGPEIPSALAKHGVKAELHVMPVGPGTFGQALLGKAHELGADLLVLGAYAHSPLHNIVFGGVTRFMLEHADIPLLMRY